MKYNIIVDKGGPDFWKRMNSLGLKVHTKQEGVIYKYVSFDTAVKIIESSALYYSTPNEFNDPFDLTIDLLDTTISKEDVIKLITEQFITTEEEKAEIIKHNLENPQFFPSIFLKELDNLKSHIGITCFSISHMKTLMWSHYAQKHSGVCLGFLFNKSGGNGIAQITVKYSSEINSINYFKDGLLSMYNWIFTKSHIWSYEEEIRRVIINKTGIINFDKNELVEIYYGLNLSQEKIQFLKSMIKKNNFNIRKESTMKINKDTFDLKEE